MHTVAIVQSRHTYKEILSIEYLPLPRPPATRNGEPRVAVANKQRPKVRGISLLHSFRTSRVLERVVKHHFLFPSPTFVGLRMSKKCLAKPESETKGMAVLPLVD